MGDDSSDNSRKGAGDEFVREQRTDVSQEITEEGGEKTDVSQEATLEVDAKEKEGVRGGKKEGEKKMEEKSKSKSEENKSGISPVAPISASARYKVKIFCHQIHYCRNIVEGRSGSAKISHSQWCIADILRVQCNSSCPSLSLTI